LAPEEVRVQLRFNARLGRGPMNEIRVLSHLRGGFVRPFGVDWRQPSDRSRGQQIQEWFNEAAFTMNAPGTIGPGRTKSALRVWGLEP
jgi:hypothetical protein